ncbi:F-box only protein 36b [Mugil cephalus]|uniref:F-box only protein 36b n=1 Tax=Mugil cephalus TaxID=48193 RepID=UPI001FB588CA|nr:F-box only protein 36b [Mugil cephalus]
MASLLTDPLFEISGRGPPPNNNFYHLFLTKSDVIWRWWKISPRLVDRYSRPGEVKESHHDFLDDTRLQGEVSMVFGQGILEYTKALCQGHYDYLEHLSDSLLLRIINYLELEDVGQLGRTSRRFRQLCGSEEFWEQAVRQRFNAVSGEMASLALEVGWRNIFFTSKLQLQKLISRRRLKIEEQQEEQVSEPDALAEESPDEGSEIIQPHGLDEESPAGIVSDPILCTDTAAGSDTSSCCDDNADLNHQTEAGSDSDKPVSDLFLEDTIHCEVETLSNGRGDFSTEPDKTQT